MHRLLDAFRQPSGDAFQKLWKTGTFFFDTSVLLNLYRYPSTARDDLLRVLAQLGNRVHLPFHVALEYERNRLSVIADQKKRFREVRDVVSEKRDELERQLEALQLRKRHASIQADELVSAVGAITDEFLRKLDELEKLQPDVFNEDSLRDKIDALFHARVGDPPASQSELDAIYKAGAARYARRTPPGYLDAAKSGSDDEFEFGGLTYKRQFGDLIVWEQVIGAAAAKKLSHVIFVTDDEKEDWWWITESQGKKRLGPRPELVDEIRRRTKVESFHMYNSEQLVRWSQQYLQVTVQIDSAEQIREAKDAVVLRMQTSNPGQHEAAVVRWLRGRYPGANFPATFNPFPDIVVETEDGRRIGYEVIHVRRRSPAAYIGRIRDVLLRAYYEMHQRIYNEFWVVVVEVDPSETDRILQTLRQREGANLVSPIGLIIGDISDAEGDEMAEFVALKVISPETVK